MSNENVTPNTAGLIRMVRAELEAAKKKDQPAHHATPGNCRGAHDAKERK